MNNLKYFIGIVPPEDIYQRVQGIQKQFGDNRLEPHITIRPPVTVNDPLAWIDAIESVCGSFIPFTVRLPGTGSFGSRVLYIDVQSRPLCDLQQLITTQIAGFENGDYKQQSQVFTPHLTLGRSWCGFTGQDFALMKQQADEYLSKEQVAFNVHSVRIYHKPRNQARYERLKDVPLGSHTPGQQVSATSEL